MPEPERNLCSKPKIRLDYTRRAPGASRPAAPPDAANVLGRGLDGHLPRTHVAADLTYVRAGARWCHVCLLVDLHDREIVGCSCGRRKDASLVKAALSNVEFPLTGIEVFHSDRGPEFRDAGIDALLAAFGMVEECLETDEYAPRSVRSWHQSYEI